MTPLVRTRPSRTVIRPDTLAHFDLVRTRLIAIAGSPIVPLSTTHFGANTTLSPARGASNHPYICECVGFLAPSQTSLPLCEHDPFPQCHRQVRHAQLAPRCRGANATQSTRGRWSRGVETSLLQRASVSALDFSREIRRLTWCEHDPFLASYTVPFVHEALVRTRPIVRGDAGRGASNHPYLSEFFRANSDDSPY